jgi:hypothetical protein
MSFPEGRHEPTDRFTIYQEVPRALWEDRSVAHYILGQIWAEALAESGGTRLPGPVLIQVVGYVRFIETNDDDLIFPAPTREDGPWVVAGVRVAGPAVPPD